LEEFMQIQEPDTQKLPTELSVEPLVEPLIRDQLRQEIEQTPDEMLMSVLDFLLFLKSRHPYSAIAQAQPPSTAASILETLGKIGKWEGDDLEECLELVHATRSRFYISTDDEQESEVGEET